MAQKILADELVKWEIETKGIDANLYLGKVSPEVGKAFCYHADNMEDEYSREWVQAFYNGLLSAYSMGVTDDLDDKLFAFPVKEVK